MNITCDGRALVGPATGVGMWTTQVMAGLARQSGHRIVLTAPKPVSLSPTLARAGVEIMPPPRLPWPGTLWLHAVLPDQLAASNTDVFIGALAVLPRRCPAPGILVVHDLTPRTHPHRHTIANRFCFNAYLEEGLDRAVSVVAVSEATATLLTSTFPWVIDKLTVIPNGVDAFFRPAGPDADADAVRFHYSQGRPYVLHLGTLEPRKGLITLIAAWETARTQVAFPLDLVLAGGEGWSTAALKRRISQSRWRSHIHVPGYVSREDARSLLRHASVFVLASEAEGFGLPLGEAIACGAPSVASDIPSLRETGGDAALYSPAGNADDLAAAILRALVPEVAAELRSKAAARAADLQWESVIHRWHDLLNQVVGRAGC